MDDPIRIQYLNDGYEALHPSFVQEITQLRPLIGKIVAFLEQMHGDETHDYRVTVSVLLLLSTSAILRHRLVRRQV